MCEENSVVIKNATVVNFDATQKNTLIYVKNGVIGFIGKENEFEIPNSVRVIDAEGKFVIPGGIDYLAETLLRHNFSSLLIRRH
jgi:dihydroorotase-like cyclic amidohydrolase